MHGSRKRANIVGRDVREANGGGSQQPKKMSRKSDGPETQVEPQAHDPNKAQTKAKVTDPD